MKNAFLAIAESLSTLFTNTHVTIALAGWPAALAVSALGLSVAAIAISAIEAQTPAPIPIPVKATDVTQIPVN